MIEPTNARTLLALDVSGSMAGGMLDVVGFDTATPSVIADFATRTWSAG